MNNPFSNPSKRKSMKKDQNHREEQHFAEILKAVAQAWHGHSSSSKEMMTVSESNAHRLHFKGKPSRFKVEAMKTSSKSDKPCGANWDFGQSLWDSYEILSVSKKLERGLVSGDPFSGHKEEDEGRVRRRRESSNSLRNLFNRMSSRRFSEEELPSQGE